MIKKHSMNTFIYFSIVVILLALYVNTFAQINKLYDFKIEKKLIKISILFMNNFKR